MKLYVKSSYPGYLYDPWEPQNKIDTSRTNMISEELPEAVQIFMESDDLDYTDYKMLQAAADAYWEEYNQFPSGYSMDSLDRKYDEDKGRFYKKYRPFVDKCKSLMSVGNVSGYGRDDFIKIKFSDTCKAIEYNFPYGWKNMMR